MSETSEVLYAAADEIDRRGWAQRSGWEEAECGTGPLCLEGAIMAATGVKLQALKECAAYTAVRSYLGCTPFLWNDHTAKTADEVTGVLRAAAVIEAAKEDRTATAPVEAKR